VLALAVAACGSPEGNSPGAGAEAGGAGGEPAVLNLYSSRHYETDEAFYEAFTAQTGIRIQRVEAKGDELIERLQSEGAQSPADVFVTVDAGRLWRAEQAGLFEPVKSPALEASIPENLRHPDGLWYGYSTRARMIFYDKTRIDPAGLNDYESLADPRFKGEVCIRSSDNIYNLSLLASIIAHAGTETAEAWARGVVANMARPPQGGDTDQLKAVAAGECGIAVANSYYFARLLASEDPADQAVVENLGWIFPNQDNRGTHINVSGAGMVRGAPHPEAARKFLEYLATDQAQRWFADGNNEFPVTGVSSDNSALEALGPFKADRLNVAELGTHQAEAQRVFDRAGWR
jgi:iron(III) transport system substrate-binding protein